MINQKLSKREYLGGDRLEGPLLFIRRAADVHYGEVCEITAPDGSTRLGRVVEVGQEVTVVELWGESSGLSPGNLQIRFRGEPYQVPVAREMLGRVFDGLGRPIDGMPAPMAASYVDVNGAPLNPSARAYPNDTIETGISTIDSLNTLIRGQKLPIFSGSGLPHNKLAAQIAQQARVREEEGDFAIIFIALGVSHDTSQQFQEALKSSGAMERSALFLNLADDPAIERTITPRVGLSLAEHLAYEEDMHLLVIITNMTNYGEALRELSSSREEVPTRKGYPGYLYTDLASLYERCGRVKGKNGSITLMPVLTMPNDDITHPIPDLTGYITEGQIVLDRDLHNKNIYPPVAVLPSLSRLMKDAIGEGFTQSDHPDLANQLYASYARALDARDLADIIGKEELNETDKKLLSYGKAFEQRFVSQGLNEHRSFEESLAIGWSILKMLPFEQLTRLSEEEIQQHFAEVEDV